MRFNEESLSFEKYFSSIYGDYKLSNGLWKMRCYHFTDGRKHTMGGRCVIASRTFAIVLDLNDFDKVDPTDLVSRKRILYAPTYNFKRKQS